MVALDIPENSMKKLIILLLSFISISVCYGNNSKAQKFKFVEYNISFEEGSYQIESAISSNYVIDVCNASKISGANVQLYQKESSNTLIHLMIILSERIHLFGLDFLVQ